MQENKISKDEEIREENKEKIKNICMKQIERIAVVSQKSKGTKLALLTLSLCYLIEKSKKIWLF